MIKNLSKWPKVQLEDLSVLIDYGLTTSASLENVGPKFLRITDIQDGYVNWDSVPFCLCNTEDKEKYKLATGDIVFARTGATTGKSYLIRECPDGTVFASYLIRVKPNSKVNPTYLYRFFQTPDYWEQIMSRSAGTAQAGVNATKLKSILLPLPPLPEQQRIAAILDKADALREKRRRAIAKLDELQKSVFLEMFDKKDFSLSSLENCLECIIDYRGKSPDKTDKGIPLITAKIIKKGRILEPNEFIAESEYESWMRRGYPQNGDVVFTTEAPLGEVAQIIDCKVALAQRVLVLRGRKELLDNTYLMKVLTSQSVKIQLEERSTGSTVKGIRQKELRKVLIPIPPLELQKKFSLSILKIKQLQEKFNFMENKLDILFSSLQQRAFSGELFAQQANEELDKMANEEKTGQMSLFDLMG